LAKEDEKFPSQAFRIPPGMIANSCFWFSERRKTNHKIKEGADKRVCHWGMDSNLYNAGIRICCYEQRIQVSKFILTQLARSLQETLEIFNQKFI
jgi:hypothetical protein